MSRLAVAVLALAAFAVPLPSNAQPAPATTAACPALLNQQYLRLQDEKPQSLCQYAGKVVLVVNTASYCGYTPQYKGLEDLHGKYRERGLVVLGFPSNDFEQEKASNKEIAEFCENTFGVKFPMFARSTVRGPKANALFKQLAASTGREPDWNFNKYLVGRDGKAVAHFPSRVTPSDPEFVRRIEGLLAAK